MTKEKFHKSLSKIKNFGLVVTDCISCHVNSLSFHSYFFGHDKSLSTFSQSLVLSSVSGTSYIDLERLYSLKGWSVDCLEFWGITIKRRKESKGYEFVGCYK